MIYESEGWQSDDRALFGTLEQMREYGTMLLVHAESARVLDELIARHHTPELMARYGARLHPMTRPNFVEAEAIQRVVQWCEATGGQLYIVHMSTARGHGHHALGPGARRAGAGRDLRPVPGAGRLGLRAARTDICSPAVPRSRSRRTSSGCGRDSAAARSRSVSTDTCTFTREQKAMWNGDWTKIPMGLPGLETLLPLVYTHGVLGGRLTLEELSHEAQHQPGADHGARIPGRARSWWVPTPIWRSSTRRRPAP